MLMSGFVFPVESEMHNMVSALSGTYIRFSTLPKPDTKQPTLLFLHNPSHLAIKMLYCIALLTLYDHIGKQSVSPLVIDQFLNIS